MDLYAFWDIAQGKNRRSDYNAIVTIGRCRRTGVLYVLDAWAQKCQAHVALKVAVEKIIEYEHRVFVVETVGAQFDMYRQIQEELSRLKIYRTRIKSFSSKTKKEERIESLEPLIESGFYVSTGPTDCCSNRWNSFREVHTMTCRTHWPELSILQVERGGVRSPIIKNHRDYKEVSETERYIRRWRVLPDGTKEA
ncbi:hypothetical protein P7H22_20280 [Paenibacillus larvae]|nr:hypothetical protein [Paenibacillus larvae]MDT2242204.1 hypothetical protein [Paenibacillus larvae]MDT2306264.1 hypothetical protein [Paenibacillus larvae]